MSAVISVDQLGGEIDKELTLYSEEILKGIKKATKSSMADLVKTTKATAPVGHRHKHYKDSIKSKKLSETDKAVSYLWYVDGADYRLSHLLEYGHVTRNGGRTKAYHFIQNATDPVLEEYQKAIEEAIKNG